MDTMEVWVNGSARLVPCGLTVHALAEQEGVSERGGIAIAVNDVVVRRGAWSVRLLEAGDRVLIITAAQGG